MPYIQLTSGRIFLQVELTEIMRQRDVVPFAKALNLLRTRTKEEP